MYISLIWIFTSTCFATTIDTSGIKEHLEIAIDIPTEAITGKPIKVTLSIKKGDLYSFAKFQQTLPAGNFSLSLPECIFQVDSYRAFPGQPGNSSLLKS